MTYVVGPNLSPSLALQAQQPLRGVWRRSASGALAQNAIGNLRTDLPELFATLDERWKGTHVYRASAPTYTEDTVTLDLVVTSPPQGYNASQLAEKLNVLVPALPLVSLDGRVRAYGEENRATDRDTTSAAGQVAADQQSVGTLISGVVGKLGLVGVGVVVVALVVAAIYFFPPTPARKSE